MTHDRYPCNYYCLYCIYNFRTSFKFDCIPASLYQLDCIFNCHTWIYLIRTKGHVTNYYWRLVPLATAPQNIIISCIPIGTVLEWPNTTIAALSPTSKMSMPALSHIFRSRVVIRCKNRDFFLSLSWLLYHLH